MGQIFQANTQVPIAPSTTTMGNNSNSPASVGQLASKTNRDEALAPLPVSKGMDTRERDFRLLREGDAHYMLRQEMYREFCWLEREGFLDSKTAQVPRVLTHPTSDKFLDLKFVYLINRHLSAKQLGDRLTEV